MPMSSALPTKSTLIKRGLCERCPKCGQGKLYQSYLKPLAACPVCGEDFTPVRADDGPAWLTIIITGHLAVPAAIYLSVIPFAHKGDALSLLLLFTITAALMILPRAKGVFFGMVWRHRQKPPAGNGKYDAWHSVD